MMHVFVNIPSETATKDHVPNNSYLIISAVLWIILDEKELPDVN